MQYIITFLLVTGTTFQVVQSATDDQSQNTNVWFSPAFTGPFIWLKNLAIDTTNDLKQLPYDIKDKVMNVFNVPNVEIVNGNVPNVQIVNGNVPNVQIVNGNVPNTELVNDNGEVKIYAISKTSIYQGLETDNGQPIQPPQD